MTTEIMMNHEDNSALVSVVIPCYNYGKYVREAVESCLASTFQNLEIIIVDDGSTNPETIAILDNLQLPRTRVIRQENKRMSAARNTGFRAARGKYVLTLDADDLIHPTLIEKAFWVLEMRPEIGFVSFWLKHFGDEDWIWKPEKFNFYHLLFANSITTTSLVRKQAWEQSGGYDESMKLGYEDWDFWIRLAKNGWLGYQIPEPLFYYRKHGVSTVDAANKKQLELTQRIRQNHPDLYKRAMQKRLRLIWDEGLTPSDIRRIPYSRAKKIAKIFIKRFIPHELRPNLIHRYRIFRIKLARKLRSPESSLDYKISTAMPFSPVRPPTFSWLDYPTVAPHPGRINVLYIFPWLELGGADKVNLDLLGNLDPERYNITILTTLESNNPWWQQFQAVTSDVFHLPSYVADTEDYGEFICKIVESRNISIVHLSNSQSGFKILPLLKLRFPHLIIVALIHNYVPEAPTDFARMAAKNYMYLDACVAITEGLKSALKNQLGIPEQLIRVIENGVDLETFKKTPESALTARESLKLPNNKQLIAFIGRLSEEKGISRFVRIAKHLSESDSYNKRLFLIVGDGPLKTQTESQIQSLQIAHKVKMMGPRDDIPEILQAVTMLIAPSQFEGLPILGLEAMATEVPILASKVVGWSHLLSDGYDGFLMEIYDEVGFARKAEEMLVNPELLREIGKNARDTVLKRYNLKRFVSLYEELYQDLLKSQNHFEFLSSSCSDALAREE